MNFTAAVEHCSQWDGWQLTAIESQEEFLDINERLNSGKFFYVTFEKEKSKS